MEELGAATVAACASGVDSTSAVGANASAWPGSRGFTDTGGVLTITGIPAARDSASANASASGKRSSGLFAMARSSTGRTA